MSKSISLSMIGFVSVLFLIAIIVAKPGNSQNPPNNFNVNNSSSTWEYARLQISDDQAAFEAGESNQPLQVFSVETLYRRLGGRSRTSLTNLLNEIGKDGWELIAVSPDEASWTFKRSAR